MYKSGGCRRDEFKSIAALRMTTMKNIIVLTFCIALISLEAYAILTPQWKFPHCRRGGGGYFTYSIKNVFVEPYFDEKLELCRTKHTKLITYMQTAVLNEPTKFINFTVTFSSPYGFFINSINGVTARWNEDGTFWCILDKDDNPINSGVSSYEPERWEVITFNFTNVWPGSTWDV